MKYKKILLIAFGAFFMGLTVCAQNTVIIERRLEIQDALSMARITSSEVIGAVGIRANLETGQSVEVRMYNKSLYNDGGRGDVGSLIYGAIAATSGSDGLQQQPFYFIKQNSFACRFFLNVFCRQEEVASTDYKERVMKFAPITTHWVARDQSYDVKIEVEFKGGASALNIQEILLPGVDRIISLDLVDSYTNPCQTNPSLAGCQSRNFFKTLTTDADKKPIVIAHRGFHGDRATAENSMDAVQRAYNDHYRFIEVDIRMTKDGVPFLFHDDYLGYATDFPERANQVHSTHVEERNWRDIKDLKYRQRYWNGKNDEPAINGIGAIVNVYLGKVSSTSLTSFEDLCKYIKGKELFVYLDIKSVPTLRNYAVMKACMSIAFTHNVLHQLAFKMVRTNLGAPPENQLDMTVQASKQQLGRYYDIFKTGLNIHIVDYRPNETAFIKDWIAEDQQAHNVIGFELDIQANPLFNSPSLQKGIADYNGKSAWEYTKDAGYRTGIWSSTALDPRGRPRHDPSQWTADGVTVGNFTTPQRYTDNRARLEILSMIAPQYITHDRPDEVKRHLESVGKLNPNTIRP